MPIKPDPTGPLVAQVFQDPHRSVRAESSATFRVFRPARSRKMIACMSSGGRKKRQNRARLFRGAKGANRIRSKQPAPAISWRWPRRKTSQHRHDALAISRFRHQSIIRRRWSAWPPTPQEPRRRGEAFPAPCTKWVEEDPTFQDRSRSADQGTRDDRYERIAPDGGFVSGLKKARQGRDRHQRAQDSLSRGRSRARPREAIATKKQTGGPAGNSARCISACFPFPAGTDSREILHQGAIPFDAAISSRSQEQFPVGRFDRRRHNPEQFFWPGPSKRDSRSGWNAA